MPRLGIYLLLGLCGQLPISVAAQTISPEEQYQSEDLLQNDFDRQTWNTTTSELDYAPKTKPKEKKKKETKAGSGSASSRSYPSRRNPGISFGDGFGMLIARFLLIVLAAILVSVLLRHLLGLTGVNRKKVIKSPHSTGTIDLDQVEENIHETDLDYYIRQALEENNFALAIRLYYLAILKELSLKKIIKWKRDKTNRDFLMEMADSELMPPFRELTHIFERVWYGKEKLDQENFRQLQPKFQRFVQQLKTSSLS